MTTPVIVAVQSPDRFRLFRANGDGAVEIGQLVTGVLPPDAAVALALGITQVLDSVTIVDAEPTPRAKPPHPLPAGPAGTMNDWVLALVTENPGLRKIALAKLAKVSVDTLAKRLARAKNAGLVHSRGWTWWPGPTAPRPYKRGMVPTRGPGTPEFVAYVREHPGLTRAELQDALDYDNRQTVSNRIQAAKGQVRTDSEGRLWPTDT